MREGREAESAGRALQVLAPRAAVLGHVGSLQKEEFVAGEQRLGEIGPALEVQSSNKLEGAASFDRRRQSRESLPVEKIHTAAVVEIRPFEQFPRDGPRPIQNERAVHQ